MKSDDERCLIEKLRKIEALFARSATQGERDAAGSARDRIRKRLNRLGVAQPAEEYRFSLSDGWSVSLFVALVRRYGLRPYRYARQRTTTVVVRVQPVFVDEVLWPEFEELNRTLHAHLHAVTARLIREAIHGDDSGVDEVGPESPVPGPEAGEGGIHAVNDHHS